MTDNKDQNEQASDQSNTFSAESVEGGQDQAPNPFAVLEKLNAENAELKDRTLRTLAEMENLRRRTEKEVADARAYATTGFARDMLNVTDNLRRALESMTQEARDQADTTIRPMLDGIELTERDLLKTLERHGIRKVEPLNERFDPNLHQAMFEAEDPTVPAGTVTQVVQPGFVIGERVLRPALVGVAKGGPKSA